MERTIFYRYLSATDGAEYSARVPGVATVTDEPDGIGGTLRVCRDEAGRILAGPSVAEITAWDCPNPAALLIAAEMVLNQAQPDSERFASVPRYFLDNLRDAVEAAKG